MKQYILMILAMIMLIGILPNAAYAHYRIWGGLPLEIGVGLDDFRIQNYMYRTDNLGLAFSLSAGLQIEMFSLSLDQELGYINLANPSELQLEEKSEEEKLFKGTTLVTLGVGFNKPDDTFFVLPKLKLGLGAVYLRNPSYLHGTASWFAMRFGFGFDFWFSDDDDAVAKLGLVFDYTLGVSRPNDYDGRRLTHFLSAKFVFAWAKWH